MAQLRKPPISQKMYRHFAVITVAVTMILAVFADGENRQALADEVDQRQEASRLQRAEVAAFGKPKLVQRKPQRRGEWGLWGYGDSFDPEYGRPTEGGTATSTNWVRQARAGPSANLPGSYAPYGISQAEWDAMSEEQRAAFLRARAPAQAPVSAQQHQRQVEGLLAASASRSGAASEAGD